jgi:hypothetical protein
LERTAIRCTDAIGKTCLIRSLHAPATERTWIEDNRIRLWATGGKESDCNRQRRSDPQPSHFAVLLTPPSWGASGSIFLKSHMPSVIRWHQPMKEHGDRIGMYYHLPSMETCEVLLRFRRRRYREDQSNCSEQ